MCLVLIHGYFLFCSSAQTLNPISLLTKLKRSPSRRTKSRWEPIQEEKPAEKPASINHETSKYAGWVNERDRKVFLFNYLFFCSRLFSRTKWQRRSGFWALTTFSFKLLKFVTNNLLGTFRPLWALYYMRKRVIIYMQLRTLSN